MDERSRGIPRHDCTALVLHILGLCNGGKMKIYLTALACCTLGLLIYVLGYFICTYLGIPVWLVASAVALGLVWLCWSLMELAHYE